MTPGMRTWHGIHRVAKVQLDIGLSQDGKPTLSVYLLDENGDAAVMAYGTSDTTVEIRGRHDTDWIAIRPRTLQRAADFLGGEA